MEQVLWFSALGGLLALDFAMVGQFMFCQPLIVGGVFGYLLGDMPSGLLIGAMVQLLWIGVLPVGAFVPADHGVTGGITVILTAWLKSQHHLALGPAMVLALALSIPAGILAGNLDVAVRYLNNLWSQQAVRQVEHRAGAGLLWLNLGGLIPAFLRNFILYFLWLTAGAWLAHNIANQLSPRIWQGLAWAFWALPALSFAAMLEMIVKDQIRWWVGGTTLVVFGILWFWPEGRLLVLAAAMLIGAVVAWRRTAW